jgi:hypothetical protein
MGNKRVRRDGGSSGSRHSVHHVVGFGRRCSNEVFVEKLATSGGRERCGMHFFTK